MDKREGGIWLDWLQSSIKLSEKDSLFWTEMIVSMKRQEGNLENFEHESRGVYFSHGASGSRESLKA